MSDRKVSFIELNEDVTAAQLKLLSTLFKSVVTTSAGRVFVGGDTVSITEVTKVINGTD